MQKVADSFAGGVTVDAVRFDEAVDLRVIDTHMAKIRAELERAEMAKRFAARLARQRRKATRLPIGSNGRRKVEAEIAWLEGRGPKPFPKGAR